MPERVEELQNHQKTELKREEPVLLPKTMPMNPLITPILQFPQNFPTMFQPINISWGFPFPSEEFPGNNQK